MNITVLTPPEFEPVTLEDCYSHLRLDPDESPPTHPDDDMLTRMIATARGEAERITNRAFVRQKIRLSAQQFGKGLRLLRPPFIEIEEVSYLDAANDRHVLTEDDYYVTDDIVPELRLTAGASWNCHARSDAVRVDYWVGYPVEGSPDTERAAQVANVPPEAVDAILLGVQLLYDQLSVDQREALERTRAMLLSGLKVHVLA